MALRKKKDEKEFENLSFEESIKNLTEIVNQIETGQVPLAESLEKYEKGMSIIRHCRQILLKAEKRIQEISEERELCPRDGNADEPEADKAEENASAENEREEEGLF